MIPWERFRREIIGRNAKFERREFDWVFSFEGDLCVCVASSWRIRNSSHILLTDYDDGHQYGLPAPVDAEALANEILANATVNSLDAEPATADLRFKMTGDILIEVLTNSSGYESWQAYLGRELAAVGRNGD